MLSLVSEMSSPEAFTNLDQLDAGINAKGERFRTSHIRGARHPD